MERKILAVKLTKAAHSKHFQAEVSIQIHVSGLAPLHLSQSQRVYQAASCTSETATKIQRHSIVKHSTRYPTLIFIS